LRLKISERYLNQILDGSPTGIILRSYSSGDIIYATPNLVNIIGSSQQELYQDSSKIEERLTFEDRLRYGLWRNKLPDQQGNEEIFKYQFSSSLVKKIKHFKKLINLPDINDTTFVEYLTEVERSQQTDEPMLIRVCGNCKMVRDGDHWEQMASFLHNQTPFNISHGICEECVEILYDI